MLQCFLISHEKGGMEDRVNLPLRGNMKAEGCTGDDFLNFKGASLFHLKLFGAVHMKVGRFEPDFVPYFPGSELGGYLFFHFLLSYLVGSLGVILSSGQI